MNQLFYYGLLVMVFFLSCPFPTVFLRSLRLVMPESRLLSADRHICYAAVILVTMMFAFLNIPLPLYYLLLYGIYMATFLHSLRDRNCCQFVINQIMIFYTTLHMLILGLFAVFSQTGIHTILKQQDTRLISLAITLGIFYLVVFFLATEDMKEKIRIVPQCRAEFMFYIHYLRFALIYVLFDSFSAFFKLSYYLMVLFLLGSTFLILLQTYVFFNYVGRIAQNAYLEEEYLAMLTEREIQLEREEILRREMHVDLLTGAYSRRYIEDNIQALIEKGRKFTLVFIDLDGLKKVNDSLGHAAGDEHLKDFTRLFSKYLNKKDILARVGGDEFYVVLPDCGIDAAYERMTFIQTRLSMEPHTNPEYPLDFSFGLSVPQPGQDMQALIQTADQSMYVNKHVRRDR